MAKLILPNGEVTDVFPKDGKTFKLDELQKLVGGYIELVTLIYPHVDHNQFRSERFIMYVDEDGISKKLPINMTATKLFKSTHGCGEVVGPALIGTVLEMSGDENDE